MKREETGCRTFQIQIGSNNEFELRYQILYQLTINYEYIDSKLCLDTFLDKVTKFGAYRKVVHQIRRSDGQLNLKG